MCNEGEDNPRDDMNVSPMMFCSSDVETNKHLLLLVVVVGRREGVVDSRRRGALGRIGLRDTLEDKCGHRRNSNTTLEHAIRIFHASWIDDGPNHARGQTASAPAAR